MNVQEMVIQVAERVTGKDAGEIGVHSSLEEDLAFDSLDAVEFSIGIEEKFGIEVTDGEVAGIATIADAIALVERKLGEV